MTQPTAQQLAYRSNRLAVALDALGPDQRSEAYADRFVVVADGEVFSFAPDGWWDDDDSQVVVCDDGAAARWRPERQEWMPIDPGSDELTDMGLAMWGSDGFGYPVASE